MGMAVFRILEGRARPGRVDEIARMFEAQAEAVGGTKGIAFVQVLRSGDQILGISCWKSGEDMQRYLELEATKAFYGQLPPLLMGTPSVRTYEVLKSLAGGGASEVLDWMNA
jgi:quinol monooxygenase YgiN